MLIQWVKWNYIDLGGITHKNFDTNDHNSANESKFGLPRIMNTKQKKEKKKKNRE